MRCLIAATIAVNLNVKILLCDIQVLHCYMSVKKFLLLYHVYLGINPEIPVF